MAKRTAGTGSLRQLPSGNWQGTFTIDGKWVSKTYRTQKEANKWLQEMEVQKTQGLTYESTKVTVKDYLERWLAAEESSIRPGTFKDYKTRIGKWLIPAFGEYLIKDLTADQIQHVYDEWLRNGIGVHTILKNHAVLGQVLKRAKQTGLVHQNVIEAVEKPRIERKEKEIWTDSEVNRFLASIYGNRMYALFYLALVTGARQMEILGLKWDDVDWVHKKLTIQRQLSREKNEFFPV